MILVVALNCLIQVIVYKCICYCIDLNNCSTVYMPGKKSINALMSLLYCITYIIKLYNIAYNVGFQPETQMSEIKEKGDSCIKIDP